MPYQGSCDSGHFKVARAVEIGGRDLLETDLDSGARSLLCEHLRSLDSALGDRRGDNLDRQVLLAGLLEQRLCLLEVLHPLGDRVVVLQGR